jgi:hypothetical protein
MAAMFVFSIEEAAVFELLDPSSSRRLVVSRTGRAFVWDPTSSTREVSFEAAQTLVKAGVVGADGRIAAAHVALWREPAQPRAAAKKAGPVKQPAVKPVVPVIREPEAPVGMVFEKTLPLGMTASGLQAMG